MMLQQQQAQQQQMFLQQYGMANSVMQQMAAGGSWQQNNRGQPGSPSAAAQFAAAFPFGNPGGNTSARSVQSYPAHPMASRVGPMQQYAAARAAAAAAGNGTVRQGSMHSAPVAPTGAAGNAGATHHGAGINNGATSRAPPGLQHNGVQQNGADEEPQVGVRGEPGADALTTGTANPTGRERRMQVTLRSYLNSDTLFYPTCGEICQFLCLPFSFIECSGLLLMGLWLVRCRPCTSTSRSAKI